MRKHYGYKYKKLIISFVIVIIIFVLLLVFVADIFDEDIAKDKPATAMQVKKAMLDQIVALGYVNQPINVPKSYKRVLVEIIPASKTTTACEEVLQRFSNTDNINNNYIDIYSYALSCEFPRPDDAETFSVSDYSGWKSDSNKEMSVLLELTVNLNHIRVESNLEVNQLSASIGAFVPFSETNPKDSLIISKTNK